MSARYERLAVIMTVLALSCVSACSAKAAASQDTTSVAPTSTPTSIQSPDPGTVDMAPTANPPDSGGANGGPAVTTAAHGIYDGSLQAKQLFYVWLNYEMQAREDNTPELVAKAYGAGIVVCASRDRNTSTDAIETVITREMGYTRSGAMAIIRSGLEALCPWSNLGYKTYFDRNVDSFMVNIKPYITYKVIPPFYAYGFFMKETCLSLADSGGSQIYAHMRSRTDLELMEGG